MFTRNALKKLFVVAVMVSLLWSDVGYVFHVVESAYAAPRNLLTEYYNALKNLDSRWAISLLDEGLTVADAVNATFEAVHAEILSGGKYKEYVSWFENFDVRITDKVVNSLLGGAADVLGATVYVPPLPDSHVKFFSSILQALRKRGADFTKASYYGDLFSIGLPVNLFKAIVIAINKKVFTGSEVENFLVRYDKFSNENDGFGNANNVIIEKLKVLIELKVKIDKSDGLISKVLDVVLPGSLTTRYLQDRDVSYLRMVFALLKRLGVNPGPKERSFWQVFSTKTPWEVLDAYREKHRNEPDILKLCNEIESILANLTSSRAVPEQKQSIAKTTKNKITREETKKREQQDNNRIARQNEEQSTQDPYVQGEKYLNDKNYSKAVEVFRQLANDGHAAAQDKLAWMYQNGWGVTQDYSQAVSWFRKAAEQGNTESLASMGLMYLKGWGVPQNYDTALEWYGKAAAQGSEVAQRRINSIQLLKVNKQKIASMERGTGFPISGTIFAETLSVRQSPNTSSKRIKTLKTGHPVSISRAVDSDNDYWFYVKTASGTKGWVLGGYVNLIDRDLSYQETTNKKHTLPASGYVTTREDSLNLRNIPTVKGSQVVEKLDSGTYFTAYEVFAGDTIDWYRIRTTEGDEGWVSGKYIELTN